MCSTKQCPIESANLFVSVPWAPGNKTGKLGIIMRGRMERVKNKSTSIKQMSSKVRGPFPSEALLDKHGKQNGGTFYEIDLGFPVSPIKHVKKAQFSISQ